MRLLGCVVVASTVLAAAGCASHGGSPDNPASPSVASDELRTSTANWIVSLQMAGIFSSFQLAAPAQTVPFAEVIAPRDVITKQADGSFTVIGTMECGAPFGVDEYTETATRQTDGVFRFTRTDRLSECGTSATGVSIDINGSLQLTASVSVSNGQVATPLTATLTGSVTANNGPSAPSSVYASSLAPRVSSSAQYSNINLSLTTATPQGPVAASGDFGGSVSGWTIPLQSGPAGPTLYVSGLQLGGPTSVSVGHTVQLSVNITWFASNGNRSCGTCPNDFSDVQVSSSNPNVATVDRNGIVTGVAVGSANITATSFDTAGKPPVTSSAPIQVVNATLTGLSIDGPTSLGLGQTVAYEAVATYSDGTTAHVTTNAAWTSSNPGVATVAGGQVTGVATGTTTIQATYQGQSATRQVTVQPASTVNVTGTWTGDAGGDTLVLALTQTNSGVTGTGTIGDHNPHSGNGQGLVTGSTFTFEFEYATIGNPGQQCSATVKMTAQVTGSTMQGTFSLVDNCNSASNSSGAVTLRKQ